MSKAFLDKLLRQEINSLEAGGSSAEFRESNKNLEHHFVVDLNSLQMEIQKELVARGYKFSKPQWKEVDNLIAEHSILIINSIKNNLVKGQNTIIENLSDSSFIVKVIEARGMEYNWLTKKVQPATIFGTIRNSFKHRRKNLVDSINLLFKSKDFKKKGNTTSSFSTAQEGNLITGGILAIGHGEESAIILQRLNISKNTIRKEIQEFAQKDNRIWDALQSNVYSVLLSKQDTLDKTVINTSIESSRLNSLRGSIEEKNLKIVYIKALKKAMDDLNNNIGLENIQGSDSRLAIEKKKQVKSFIEGVKSNKRVKKSSIGTKIKLSNTKSKKVTKQRNNKSVIKKTISSDKILLADAKVKKSSINLNALKAQINARLSMTVIKNMGTPALENRTGRFARSVEVTDVIQTAKGFPSIGYTYQKGPYQTFEPGFAHGSTQRDPRTLIDRSIREIAQELVVGRFYTRRT